MSRVILVKLGGSIVTEKERPGRARLDVIDRLAREIGEAAREIEERIVLGHGAGSFGHPPAARFRLREGLEAPGAVGGMAETQERAAALHRLVRAALERAGLAPFTVAPSSGAVAENGRVVAFPVETVALALRAGLLPVVYGDVVVDRSRGAGICSTEEALERLAEGLPERGWAVARALWLGDTGGVYDEEGEVVPTLRTDRAVPGSVGPARTTDVTGGMAHRVDITLRLAGRGTPSWIGDGNVAGNLERALRGDLPPGTRVEPGGGA